jgi:putative zinc finger protein
MSHLEAGLLHALLDGEIASSELPPIQAHLAGCAECRARLEQERQLLAEAEGMVETLEVPAGEVSSSTEASPRPRLHWGRPLAWAASVVAAVGLGFVARGAPALRVVGEVAQQQPAAPADLPSAVASTSESAKTSVPSAEVAPLRDAPPSRRSSGVATRKAAIPPEEVALVPPIEEAKVASERSREAVTPAVSRPDSLRRVAEPAAAPPAAGALGARRSARRLDQTLRLEEAVVTGAAERTASNAVLAPPEPISLPDAIRRLGGSLRLIDGLVPLRLEAQGPSVRVVYAAAQGELVLSQQLIDGRVVSTLIPPQGFPPDSLLRLKARVRD